MNFYRRMEFSPLKKQLIAYSNYAKILLLLTDNGLGFNASNKPNSIEHFKENSLPSHPLPV